MKEKNWEQQFVDLSSRKYRNWSTSCSCFYGRAQIDASVLLRFPLHFHDLALCFTKIVTDSSEHLTFFICDVYHAFPFRLHRIQVRDCFWWRPDFPRRFLRSHQKFLLRNPSIQIQLLSLWLKRIQQLQAVELLSSACWNLLLSSPGTIPRSNFEDVVDWIGPVEIHVGFLHTPNY